MLVGHFAAAMVGKSVVRNVPLWHFLLLANISDLLWVLLCLVGKEAFGFFPTVPPGASMMFSLDLSEMPWSHGLLPVAALAALLGYFYLKRLRGNRGVACAVVFVVVLSHWFLDLVVHRPDLLVYSGIAKQGWGLWARGLDAVIIELSLLGLALLMYLKRTRLLPPTLPAITHPRSAHARLPVFLLCLVVLQLLATFVSFGTSTRMFEVLLIVQLVLVCGLGAWMDRVRGARYVGQTYRLDPHGSKVTQ
jgi:hypothetical protein